MSRKDCCSAAIAAGIAVATVLTGCAGTDTVVGIGGSSSAVGGVNSASSAASGGTISSGGALTGAGAPTSSTAASGGSAALGGAVGTGGANATGGAGQSTGGVSASSGSIAAGGFATGGGPGGGAGGTGGAVSTGGSVGVGGSSTGGSRNTGGTVSTGGIRNTGGSASTGGTRITGGAPSTGGVVATGGATSTGGATGSNSACPGADPTEFALIQAWLNNTNTVGALPSYAYTNIKNNFSAGAAFNKLACSIAMSCVEFAPLESNWLRKCEAVLTSAIVAESSYTPTSVVYDSYGGTTDPTVGLLQIRFSSTVHDYNYYGPMAKIAAIGCIWPSALLTQADTTTFWRGQGVNYLSFMQDVSCNIGLAAWYYFYNATGNGGASAVWISNYCAGQGVAGDMVVGLLSHLQGGSYTRPADANNAYPWGIECCACGNPSLCTCTGCTGRFAAFMGIGTSSSRPSPDPFLETLAPEPSKYCK